MTSVGRQVALGQQHQGVVQQVGGLAGEGRRGSAGVEAGGVVLGGEQHLGRLLGDLAADGVDPAVEQRRRVRARPGGRSPASCDRRPQRLEPGEALRRPARRARSSASKHERVPRWQVGPTGSTVTSRASPSQSTARPTSRRTLPLVSPLRHSRSREREWKWTSPVVERRGEGLGVHVGEHQDPAVGGVLDDAGHEAVGAEADRRRVGCASRHATASGTSRTGSPAAAIAALTAAIEWIRRWKIEAASTASAPPSTDRGDEVVAGRPRRPRR